MRLLRWLLLVSCSILSCFAQGRINAGGAAFTDALGQLWQADSYFTGGAVSTGAIPPGTPGYYLSKRYGDFTYLLPVPAGQYTVALNFLENVVAAGGRVFSVSINGAPVLTGYDIAADVGMNVPVRKVFPVTVLNAGILVQFTTVTRSAIVNAIEFGPAPAVVPVVIGLSGLESAPPPCPDAGIGLLHTTDGDHFYWCANGGQWVVIGAGPMCISGCAQLIGLEECSGSGTNADGMGWDCAGLLRATVRLNGAVIPVVGTSMVLAPNPLNTWTAK
jgi:hypothetical protein